MSMSQSEEELFQTYKAELEQLEKAGFQIYISLKPTQAVALVGTIQLALRHPQFKGPASIMAFKFVRWIQQELAGPAPATAEMIRRGGLRQYDQPRKKHPKKGGNHAN